MISLRTQLMSALRVSLVGGFVLGAREGILTLEANAFVQPGQYAVLYLAVPVLLCMALIPLMLLPFALVLALLRPAANRARMFCTHAAMLGLIGAATMVAPWLRSATATLRAVGGDRALVIALAWGAAAALVAGAMLVLSAAALWYANRVQQPLRVATLVVLATALVLMVPAAHFLVTDWTWDSDPLPSVSAAPNQSNLLLISIDTLRADHLGSYNGSKGSTPNLDRLGAEGVVFEQAITSSPWTLPAIASLLTGLHPHHHGAGRITNRRDPLGRSRLEPDVWTLATALSARGYLTHAIVTNPYLSLHYGFGDGFAGYENLTIASEFFLAARNSTAGQLLHWLAPEFVTNDGAREVTARAREFLARAQRRRPFFLWLHYVDPHAPYDPPTARLDESFRGDSLLSRSVSTTDAARLRSGEIRPNEVEKENIRALYRAEVKEVDGAVGGVLAALEARGLDGDTLVIVVSDHGEEFWEHGGFEHGHTLYEEVIRVPLLMRWPGRLMAGQRVEALVRLVDVAPTVSELLGLAPAPEADGISLGPMLRGEDDAPRVALIENLLFAEERVAIRTANRKYVLWTNGKEETYDLLADPRELHDLAGIAPIVESLRSRYEAVATPGIVRPAGPVAAGRTEESLRSLGYLR